MKTRITCVAWLLPLMLTACFHKNQQAATRPVAPPIVDNTAPKPTPTPTEVSPSAATVPTQPATAQIKPPDQPLKPKTHHKKPANKETEQAASGSTIEVSAIGQLAPPDPPDLQQETRSSIESTERSLNEITRKLNDQETKTAAQIREFLKQAKTALASGDIDGAHTLALKAKVLLDEISH